MWWVYVSLCLYEFIGTGNCSMLDGTKLLPTLRLKYQFYLLWPSGIISQQYRSIRMFPPAIDIIPTSLAVVYSNGKYTNYKN